MKNGRHILVRYIYIRLNKFLSETGICSRREADKFILDNKVTVNGKVTNHPNTLVASDKDSVKVAGKRVRLQPLTYILLNKPEGVLTTLSDPNQRATVKDLLRGVKIRVYPVGRLDFNTSGVLLLTNDGELAARLTHPRYGFTKTYQAKVSGVPTDTKLRKMGLGVKIPGIKGSYEMTLPAKVKLVRNLKKKSILQIIIKEGKKHQVKKMCAAIGHPVVKLVRLKFGFLSARGLMPGKWRYLNKLEQDKLKESVGLKIN